MTTHFNNLYLVDFVECRLSIFVSDIRSRMTGTLSMSRDECKTSTSFLRRIVSNALDKFVPSISITYVYRWRIAAIHLCPYLFFSVGSKSTLGWRKETIHLVGYPVQCVERLSESRQQNC